jgi:hypothetical protein
MVVRGFLRLFPMHRSGTGDPGGACIHAREKIASE